LLAWHRKLLVQEYDGSGKRGPGRPRTRDKIEDLVVRLAAENRVWGYRRIQGALANLSYEVARGTMANILKEHGLDPAPECNRTMAWREFLNRHWKMIVAADFFTVEPWTRRVEIAGIATGENGIWIDQVARQWSEVRKTATGVAGFESTCGYRRNNSASRAVWRDAVLLLSAGGGADRMIIINRTAIMVRPGQPFLDWLHRADPASRGLNLEDLRREPTIYLLPEGENEEAVRELLK
jgi:hypothetical protein